MAGDDISVLDTIVMYGESLPVDWPDIEHVSNSTMWGHYPRAVVDAMAQKGLALHAHTNAISLDTFNRHP